MSIRTGGHMASMMLLFFLSVGLSMGLGCASTTSGDSSHEESMSHGASIEGDYAADLPLHHVLWQRAASGGEAVADLFMMDGTLFVVTESNSAYAIDGAGSHLWAHELGQAPDWRPAVNSTSVAFVSDNDLIVVSRAHGERKVKKRLPFSPCGPPSSSEAAIYIPSWQGDRIHALDPHSGDTGWRYVFNGPVLGRAAVVGMAPRQTLVAASEGGEVVGMEALAHDAQPGDAIWTSSTLDRNTTDLVAIGNELVLVASRDTNLYAFNPITGQKVWAYPSGMSLTARPVVCGDMVFLPTKKGLIALGTEMGDVKWKNADCERFLTRDESQVVLLGNGGDLIHTLNAQTGEVLESHDASGYKFCVTNPTGDGVLYLATENGEMIALDGKAISQ